jgi:hypothetical protein
MAPKSCLFVKVKVLPVSETRKRISFNTNLNLNIASHHLQNSDEFRILVTFLSLFHYHSRRCAQCNLRLRHDVVIEV